MCLSESRIFRKILAGIVEITYYHSVKGIITKIITKRICFDLSCYTIGVSLFNRVPCFVYDVKRLEQRFCVPAYDFHCLSSQLFQQCLKTFQHGQKVTCQLVPKFESCISTLIIFYHYILHFITGNQRCSKMIQNHIFYPLRNSRCPVSLKLRSLR